jgi:hypothetical protein
VWDKLHVESKDSVEKVLNLFEKTYGRRIGRLYYKNIVIFEDKKEDVYG